MPTATKEQPGTAAPPAAKRSILKSKKAIIVLLVLLVAAAGAYKVLATPAAKAAKPTGGDIVPLSATTLNLQDNHYLKIGVAVQLVAAKAPPTDFKTRAVEMVISQFSNRTVTALSTNAGRTQLLGGLETELKSAYPGDIYNVFLTQFVTQ